MRIDFRIAVSGVWAAVAAGAVAFGAQTASRDLIVRTRAAADTSDVGRGLLGSIAGLGEIKVLSGPDGVLQLRFETEQAARAAAAKLASREGVLSVTPNHLYRPEVQYAFREQIGPVQKSPPLPSISANLPDLIPVPELVPGADPLVRKDWALKAIHQPAWETIRSLIPDEAEGQFITAVIDSGIDYNHEDLSGALWHNPTRSTEVGWDFVHDQIKPYDVVKFDVDGCLKDPNCQAGVDAQRFLVNPGHGTHCAGHIAALAHNSLGGRGVGSRATRLMSLKFIFDSGDEHPGQGDDAAAIKSIDYAIAHGARIINTSWGSRYSREDAEKSELKAALTRARDAGILVVTAAGNDAIDNDSEELPTWPASFELDNLITVAAVDSKDRLADFSSYGVKHVHIAAPGVRIFSTIEGSGYSDQIASYVAANGKTQVMDWNGTSMAAPLVAGAVALVWAAHPQENYHQIRDRILQSARKVDGLAGKVAFGGVLDVRAAVGR